MFLDQNTVITQEQSDPIDLNSSNNSNQPIAQLIDSRLIGIRLSIYLINYVSRH